MPGAIVTFIFWSSHQIQPFEKVLSSKSLQDGSLPLVIPPTESLHFAFKISLQPNLSKTESSEGKSFVWDPNRTKVKNDGSNSQILQSKVILVKIANWSNRNSDAAPLPISSTKVREERRQKVPCRRVPADVCVRVAILYSLQLPPLIIKKTKQ